MANNDEVVEQPSITEQNEALPNDDLDALSGGIQFPVPTQPCPGVISQQTGECLQTPPK